VFVERLWPIIKGRVERFEVREIGSLGVDVFGLHHELGPVKGDAGLVSNYLETLGPC